MKRTKQFLFGVCFIAGQQFIYTSLVPLSQVHRPISLAYAQLAKRHGVLPYNLLKAKKMVKELEGGIAYVDYSKRQMALHSRFFEKAPSTQAFVLRHEIGHQRQFQYLYTGSQYNQFVAEEMVRNYCNTTGQKFDSLDSQNFDILLHEALEHDADSFACSVTDCPICLAVTRFELNHKEHDWWKRGKGYFDNSNFDKWIQQKACQGAFCKAHQKAKNQRAFMNYLQKKNDMQKAMNDVNRKIDSIDDLDMQVADLKELTEEIKNHDQAMAELEHKNNQKLVSLIIRPWNWFNFKAVQQACIEEEKKLMEDYNLLLEKRNKEWTFVKSGEQLLSNSDKIIELDREAESLLDRIN